MCTKGAPCVVTDNGGLNFNGSLRMHGTMGYIPYSLTYVTPAGAGGGQALSVDTYARVLDVDYANVPEGTYTDEVTLTIQVANPKGQVGMPSVVIIPVTAIVQ